MGKDDWSPRYSKQQELIDLLRRVNCWKAGRKTSVWEMKQLAKKQGFTWQELMAKNRLQIIKDLNEAYRVHYANKDKYSDWRSEHCISLRQAKADKEGVEVKVIDKRMKRERHEARKKVKIVNRSQGKVEGTSAKSYDYQTRRKHYRIQQSRVDDTNNCSIKPKKTKQKR